MLVTSADRVAASARRAAVRGAHAAGRSQELHLHAQLARTERGRAQLIRTAEAVERLAACHEASASTMARAAAATRVRSPRTASERAAIGFGPEVAHLSTVRARVRARLGDRSRNPAQVEVVVLLVSELVTNAISHTGSGGVVVLQPEGSKLRIEVHDLSPVPPRADAPGRGLRLVEALTAAWGSRPGPLGKLVWAEVPG